MQQTPQQFANDSQYNVGPVPFHNHDGVSSQNVSPDNLTGYILYPTVPTRPGQGGQVIMVGSASSYSFYVYANNAWNKVASSTSYFGIVASGVASTPFPSGWSVTKNSTGDYTITHNLGTTTYAVLTTEEGSQTLVWPVISKGANSFEVLGNDYTTNTSVDGTMAFNLLI